MKTSGTPDAQPGDLVWVGVDSDSVRVGVRLREDHKILCGATRSGKTNTARVLLAGATLDPAVAVVGIDPSGLLLAPFEDAYTTHGRSDLVVTGTGDLPAAVDLLNRLVKLMESRTVALRARGTDTWSPTQEHPTVLVVLEEYGGLLAACENHDARVRPEARLRPVVAGHVGRLLREAAKTQILMLTIIQRPDAAVIGGSDRSQYGLRIIHRLDNADGVRMLHESATPTQMSGVMSAGAGVGLITQVGGAASFFRAVSVSHGAYLEHVASRALVRSNLFDRG